MTKLLALLALTTAIAHPAAAPAQQRPPTPASASPAATTASPGDEYTVSAGDKVHVIVFGEETLTGDYVITSAGNLSFPLVGNLPATGKTVEQLQIALAHALADGYIKNPRVNIQVVSFRPFYILGEVNHPGDFAVSTGLTLQQAVASAGGYTYRANTHRAYLKRAGETTEQLLDLRHGEQPLIHAGDTIRISERHF